MVVVGSTGVGGLQWWWWGVHRGGGAAVVRRVLRGGGESAVWEGCSGGVRPCLALTHVPGASPHPAVSALAPELVSSSPPVPATADLLFVFCWEGEGVTSCSDSGA